MGKHNIFRAFRHTLGVVLLLFCMFFTGGCAHSALNKDGYGFFKTADMLNVRKNAAAVLLKDGRVFISGGWDTTVQFWYNRTLKSTEIYDPKTGTFTYGPDLNVPRTQHAMAVMDDGRVLIAGGSSYSYLQNGDDDPIKKEKYRHIEIYDPKTNKITQGPKLLGMSVYDDAQILNIGDGEYLIGTSGGGKMPSFLIFYSKNNTINFFHGGLRELKPISYMKYLGNNEIALFNQLNGRVDVINKKTGKVLRSAVPNIERFISTFTQLDNGKIVVIEGRVPESSHTAEIYEKDTNKYRMVKDTSQSTWYQIVKLSNNKIILKNTRATEIFDGNTETFDFKEYNLPARCNVLINLSSNAALCAGTIDRNRDVTKHSYIFKY